MSEVLVTLRTTGRADGPTLGDWRLELVGRDTLQPEEVSKIRVWAFRPLRGAQTTEGTE